jgi:hypothetical protein
MLLLLLLVVVGMSWLLWGNARPAKRLAQL